MWNTKRTLFRFMLIYILVFSVVTWNVEQRWQVTVVAAAVSQARTEAARGFAASLYGRPKGMELAIFNDLFFFSCSFFFRFGGPVWSPRRSPKQSAHTALPAFLLSLHWCQLGAEYRDQWTLSLRHSNLLVLLRFHTLLLVIWEHVSYKWP